MFDGFVLNDSRFRFNIAVSPGQEINASVGEYMDFALDLPSTRVIALFIETVRDTDAFIAALKRAREKDVAVVVVKVGRTERSAQFARTHTDALVGDDAVFDAVFDAVLDRYGAVRVRSCDELFSAALRLSLPKRTGAGGLSAVFDSGGLRSSLIDLATQRGVQMTELGSETMDGLAEILPAYMSTHNPIDVGVPFELRSPGPGPRYLGKTIGG